MGRGIACICHINALIRNITKIKTCCEFHILLCAHFWYLGQTFILPPCNRVNLKLKIQVSCAMQMKNSRGQCSVLAHILQTSLHWALGVPINLFLFWCPLILNILLTTADKLFTICCNLVSFICNLLSHRLIDSAYWILLFTARLDGRSSDFSIWASQLFARSSELIGLCYFPPILSDYFQSLAFPQSHRFHVSYTIVPFV
jgi:hypothetical protein